MNNAQIGFERDNCALRSARLLEAALDYAGRGWRVLPLHTPTTGGCSCQKSDCYSIGKHPRIHNGQIGASLDSSTINNWWARWPNANIGVATGPDSGVVVLDVDGAVGQVPEGAGDDPRYASR
jgi:hypothetical protein